MTAERAARLSHVLKLALSSPYEGERQKAVALLGTLLEREGLRLAQLDASFAPADGLNEVRARAGLPYRFTEVFKSREEGVLYGRLLEHLGPPEPGTAKLEQTAGGFEFSCVARADVKSQAERAYQLARLKLSGRLAAAQEQALQEYRRRRQVFFDEAIQALTRETLAEETTQQ